ncbi:hypothetical protein AVEN_8505-1 [Araneus ventricosus]|uniref:SOCS box domain-containing protein n=1 Tax=Araneus ventricosus TaxID=182803 RepID=A0A4Y2PCW7_ARAVE|nr:hypothetical protein AVEN_8505-1 [Araneus ventricosus]
MRATRMKRNEIQCNYAQCLRNIEMYLHSPSALIKGVKSTVEYSFIVQRSVTCLDLSLCEFSKFKRKPERESTLANFIKIKFKYLEDEIEKINAIFTEEACKKRLARNRKLLYNYHLDVSKELEVSLRNAEPQDIRKCYSNSVLLNRIVLIYNMYETYLNKIITKTLQETNQKVRLIHQVSKMAKHLNFVSKNKYIRDKGLFFLYLQRADSTVGKDFLIAMDFEDDYYFCLSVDVFEFVLYHVGYDLWSRPSCEDPIHTAIFDYAYVKAGSLLQYRDSPRFCGKLYRIMNSNRLLLSEDELNIAFQNGLITKERYFLIVEILHVLCGQVSGGLKALQMVWRSIPDPFVTLDELTLVFARPPDSRIVQRTRRFVKDITGEDVRDERGHQPRKLKHYCRTLIRRVLSNNKQLSTGIGEMKLPTSIVSFLRLEN